MDCNETRGTGQAAPGNTAPVLQVLVVENDLVNRTVLCAATMHFGHVPHEATDGAQAVERVAAGGIDLVFMDIDMPGMDGLEATRLIRALAAPLNSTPIWVVSAHVFLTDTEAALAAGADAFLSKPLFIPTLENVFQRVQQGIRRGPAAPAGTQSAPPPQPAAPCPYQASALNQRHRGDYPDLG